MVVGNLHKQTIDCINDNKQEGHLRSLKLGVGADGFVRKSGKKTCGINTAKQANTIAKTTLGRVRRDIIICKVY